MNTSERHTRNKGERNGIGKMIRITNHQNKNKHVLSFCVTGIAPSALCFNYLNPPKQSKEIRQYNYVHLTREEVKFREETLLKVKPSGVRPRACSYPCAVCTARGTWRGGDQEALEGA